MIYRQTKEQIQAQYTDSTDLNQSSIKIIIDEGMEAFLVKADQILHQEEQLYYEEKEHFIVGHAVDDYTSLGKEYYENNYYFSKLLKKPGATGMSVIKMVFDMVKPRGLQNIEPLLHYREQIYQAIEEHKYYNDRRKEKWEDDTRYTQLLSVKTGSTKENTYWQDLIEAGDRQILSDMQNSITSTIINSWFTHPNTARFFTDGPNVDIIYQFPVFFTYKGVKCRGLIDHIYIDHTNKFIFVLDEKTIGDYITRFNVSMYKRRYDIQGSFYSYGFTHEDNLQRLCDLIGKSTNGYKIISFAFIVESTKKPGTPLIFPLNDKLIEQGQFGDGADLLGWDQGIQIYKEWQENEFDINKVYGKNNGIVFIDETFNYVNKLQ